MSRRRTSHALSALVASTVSAALLVIQCPTQAFADEIPVNIPIATYTQPIVIDNSGNVTIPIGPQGESLPSQCSPTGAVDTTGIAGNLCLGTPSATDPVPVDVTSGNGLYTPVVKTGGRSARPGLTWRRSGADLTRR